MRVHLTGAWRRRGPGVPTFTKRMAQGLLLIADASPTEVEAVRDALVKSEG
jgi:hypothetical protein